MSVLWNEQVKMNGSSILGFHSQFHTQGMESAVWRAYGGKWFLEGLFEKVGSLIFGRLIFGGPI